MPDIKEIDMLVDKGKITFCVRTEHHGNFVSPMTPAFARELAGHLQRSAARAEYQEQLEQAMRYLPVEDRAIIHRSIKDQDIRP